MLNRPRYQSADQPTYVTESQPIEQPNSRTVSRCWSVGVGSQFISLFKNVFHIKYINIV